MTERERQDLAGELVRRLLETIGQTTGEPLARDGDGHHVLVLVLGRLLAMARRIDES